MKNILKFRSLFFVILLVSVGCSDPDYEMGDLTAPSNIVLDADIVGQDEAHPYGDGSGEVILTVTADNGVSYKIDYGKTEDLNLVSFPSQQKVKYTKTGVHTYTITIIAYGPGGSPTMVTRELTIESIFEPAPEIIPALVGDGSKTWVVDKSVAGHFGVGPWTGSVTPEWWSAGVNEKVEAAPCFYSATFTFTQVSENQFTLDVDAPQGAFTKTGDLTTLPGIPDSGAEGCYDGYEGGTSDFSFGPATTGIAASTPSTQTSINLVGNDTFIGYGAVQKEYEILEITPEFMYLRVQGADIEAGNAWYLRLVPAE